MAAEAGADWIFFLDADDVLDPQAFVRIIPYLGKYDAVWGAIHELADDEEGGVEREGQVLNMWSLNQLLANDPWLTLQIGHFVRTDVALANPFDPQMDCGEDFDYYLRLWSSYRCVKVAVPFFFNRRNAHAGGPRAATGRQWREVVQRLLCEKCAATGFYSEFTYRGETFRFLVSNPFDIIQRQHLKQRFFEVAELEYLDNWVGPGARILEVGAYVGNHVVYYSRFLHPQSIDVFEPNPEAISLLRRNLDANSVREADLSHLGLAIADKKGTFDVVCSDVSNLGAARLQAAATGSVRAVTLDEVVAHPVNFIKIDVEGMELAALAGARKIIGAWRPKIMIEVFREHIPAFRQWMDDNRYGVARAFECVHAVNFLIQPDDGAPT